MNHKLNMQIAKEVMGFHCICIPLGAFGRPGYLDDDNWWHSIPDYSGSLDAAWQMEEEIEQQRLQYDYVSALRVVQWDDLSPAGYYPNWSLVHATPEQRCRAALSAVRTEGLGAVRER